jgi:hypothetical protein
MAARIALPQIAHAIAGKLTLMFRDSNKGFGRSASL